MLTRYYFRNKLIFFFIPALFLFALMIMGFSKGDISKTEWIFLIFYCFFLSLFLFYEGNQIIKKFRLKASVINSDQFIQPKELPFTKRLKLGKTVLSTEKNLIVLVNQNNKEILKIDKTEKSVKISRLWFHRTYFEQEIDYLVLEYDNIIKNTWKGMLTRGELDRFQSINVISARLKTGKLIKLCEITFSEVVFTEIMHGLQFDEDQLKEIESLSIGKRTTALFASALNKRYKLIDYSSN